MTKVISASIDQISALGKRFKAEHPAAAHRWAEVLYCEDGLHVPDDLASTLRKILPAAASARHDQILDAAKIECRRRIVAALPETTQANLAAAAAAGAMQGADLAAYRDAVEWVRAMRERCALIAEERDPVDVGDDAHWPPEPGGLEDLAARF